jgi:hypothetical protein
MKIQLLFVVVFLFLHQSTHAAYDNKHEQPLLSDTLPSKAQCLTLNQLIQIMQLETKSASTILNLLLKSDTSWQHKGTDKSEIVFSVKEKLRYILTWKRKEQALILFFFSTPEYDTFNQQLINADFQFVREDTVQSKQSYKLYKKDKLVVKIWKINLTSPGNYYILTVQLEGE